MSDKETTKSKIKKLQGDLSTAHEEKVRLATGKVDMVEHQALRQEVESLRKTVKEMQQELEHANTQGRLAEDQLEDKNDVIERLSQEVDGLKEALQESEERRYNAEESKLQAESRASVLQEKLDSGAGGKLQVSTGNNIKPMLTGLGAGAVATLLLLEVLSVSGGKGELFSNLGSDAKQAPPRTVQAGAPESGSGTAETESAGGTEKPATTQTTVAAGRSDGNRIVEDPDAGYALISMTGGDFMMGNRTGAVADESPFHHVNLKPFLIGRSEVSFDLYARFARATDRSLPDDNGWGRGSMPVTNVSWDDAQALADWLSTRTSKKYRLPTEAEWEYAAGGGRESTYWWGYRPGENNANCFNCGSQYDRRQPAPVETFKVNPFGLHSTAGNVQEWVRDCYRKGYADAPTNGSAVEAKECSHRVIRGGAFNKPADSMKVSKRSYYPVVNKVSHIGIRLARDPD